MQTYIVSFESVAAQAAILSYLKSHGTWAKLTNSTWAVVTTKSASEIRDELLALAHPGDRLFVVRSGAIAAWSNVHARNDWLKKHL